MHISKIYRRYIVSVLIILIMLSGWWVFVLSHTEVAHEWVLENGAGKWFVAETDSLQKIGICKDDINAEIYADPYAIKAKVIISDQNGECVWNSSTENVNVYINSIQPDEGLIQKPVYLHQGQKYKIECISEKKVLTNLTYAFYGEKDNILPFFLLLGSLLIFVYSFVYFFFYKVLHFSYLNFFVISMAFAAITCSIIMIPFCVPDEPMHFSNAYYISIEMMKLLHRPDANMVATGILRNPIFGKGQDLNFFWSDWVYGNKMVPCANRYSLIGGMPHYSYIIPALGITVARMTGAPYQIILIAGRIANMLMYTAVTLLAMRICPSMKWAVTAISFLPSTVWLADSYSYDAWNLAFSILLVCYCVYCRDLAQITWINGILIMIITLIFAPIKFLYAVIAFMALLVPRKAISKEHQKQVILISVFAVLTVCIILILTRGDEVFAFLRGNNFDIRSDAAIAGTSYSPLFVVNHPLNVMLVFFHTIVKNFESYIIMCFLGENYAEHVPSSLFFVQLVLFMLIMSGTGWKLKTTIRERNLAIGVTGIGVLSVFVAFLFLFSVPSTGTIGLITGVQGRYFLPFLILTPFFCAKKKSADQIVPCIALMIVLSEIVSLAKFSGIIGS